MFAIKAAVRDTAASTFMFRDQKTMYGGKRIARGDRIYIFASENEGGTGLIARGIVDSAEPTPRKPGIDRQTPRVSIVVERTGTALRRLGRDELRPHQAGSDGDPEDELNFKFYRQATNKIVGLSAQAAAFLETHFTGSRS